MVFMENVAIYKISGLQEVAISHPFRSVRMISGYDLKDAACFGSTPLHDNRPCLDKISCGERAAYNTLTLMARISRSFPQHCRRHRL